MNVLRLALPALLLAFPLTAHAVPIIASPTGLAGPKTTLTFDEVVLPKGTPVINQYSAFGVAFAGLFYNPQPGFSTFNLSPPDLGNFPVVDDEDLVVINPISIIFSSPLTAAAFATVTNEALSTFTAFLGNSPVESFAAPTDTTSPNNFFGFTGITFDRIDVNVASFASLGNEAILIDNLQRPAALTAVSEPGVPGLLLLSLGAMGLLRRKTSYFR